MVLFDSTRRRWSADDDEMLLEMHAQGFSLEEMARALNRTLWAVPCRLRHLGFRGKNVLRKKSRPKSPTPHEAYTHMLTGSKSPRYLKCLIRSKTTTT